jgi:hypothetical protein
MIEKIIKKAPTIYELNSQDTFVKIGGAMPDKFVPNINASKWNDECWLNINHPDSVIDEIEEFILDKVSLRIGNNTHRCYALENGDLEYEIEYASRPDYDVEIFDLTFPDGLNFTKQLPLEYEWARDNMGLSLSEYLTRVNRPDNIINSYAVYWEKQDNQYKTGKFCHIYRAELIDADGDRSWCDMNIDPITKKMQIIMDGIWLDSANYPVILDPVLGYDTYGASSFGTNFSYTGRVYQTDAIGGNIQSFHCSVATISGTPGVKLAIANVDQGTGDPSSKSIVEQIELIPISANSTINIDAISKNLLSPSTLYSVLWISDSTSTDIRFDTGLPAIISNSRASGGDYAGAFPDPLPTGFGVGSVTSRYSTWVVYELSAGVQILRRRIEGC